MIEKLSRQYQLQQICDSHLLLQAMLGSSVLETHAATSGTTHVNQR